MDGAKAGRVRAGISRMLGDLAEESLRRDAEIFSVARADEALGLVLLLFTALVTAELADGARQMTETAREAAVVRRSDELKTALLRAVWQRAIAAPAAEVVS